MDPGQVAAADAARDRMGELGLVQRSLAQKAGVDPKTVNSFLTYKHFPNARNRSRIESALWPHERPGALMRIVRGAEPPGAPEQEDADPVEAQILAIPHLLDQDRELFLRVYRTRRDEHTVRRLADLEQLLAASIQHVSDPEVRETITGQFQRQIRQLKQAGYVTPGSDTET